MLYGFNVGAPPPCARGGLGGKVLVEFQAKLRHAPRSLGGNRQDALAGQIRRVRDGRGNMLALQSRVLIEDALV